MSRNEVACLIGIALIWLAVGYAGLVLAKQERQEEVAGYWMTIAAEDSTMTSLDLSTLQSTQDYGDSAFAEVHQLTRHYRVLHAKDAVFLQLWVRP